MPAAAVGRNAAGGQASPPSRDTGVDQMNWSGGNGGVMAIAGRGGFAQGDIQSAEAYGARIKDLTQRFQR